MRELLPAAVVRLTEEDGRVEHHQVLTAVCTEAAILNTFGGWVLQPSVKDKEVCGTGKFSGGRVWFSGGLCCKRPLPVRQE